MSLDMIQWVRGGGRATGCHHQGLGAGRWPGRAAPFVWPVSTDTLVAWSSAPSFCTGCPCAVDPVHLGGWEAASTSDSGHVTGEVFVAETQL